MFETPFEKNIVPRFVEWLLDILRLEDPDVLVPVERKGVHLLDTTLDNMRSQFGLPARTPILYRRAFFFIDPVHMADRKILLIDDATRSGTTLNLNREVVKSCGNPVVRMIACIGLETDDHQTRSCREDIRCFREVPPDLYHEYVWEISELITSSGLPPEVDHHVFVITPRESFSLYWASLLELLDGQGQLDLHGKISDRGPVYGATLHWPRFFDESILPRDGPIRRDGIIKLRIFADFQSYRIFVIPMVFPVLEFQLRESESSLDLAQCRSFYEAWHNIPSEHGRMLFGQAHDKAIAPEVLYYAVSLSCDVEMVKEFAALIGEKYAAEEQATFSCDPERFSRLYGPELGLRLVRIIDEEINQALHKIPESSPELKTSMPSAEDVLNYNQALKGKESCHQINISVNEAARQLGSLLKTKYYEKNQGKPEGTWEAVGYSYGELLEMPLFSTQTNDHLLLSRCIDFGCGNTNLVPYISIDIMSSEHTLWITRKYRTSEAVELVDQDNVKDAISYIMEVSEETVAAVVYFLRRRSKRWKDRPIPPLVLNKVLAILFRARPDRADTSLAIIASPHGPEIVLKQPHLVGEPSRTLVRNVKSEYYRITSEGGFEVTPSFVERYKDKSLRISHRRSLRNVEAYMSPLVQVLDEATNVTELLTCWSMSAGGKLGLDYAMVDVKLALDSLLDPLNVLLGGGQVDAKKFDNSQHKARKYCGIARSKIEDLKQNWSNVVRKRWQDPIEVERDLLASLFAPSEGADFLMIAGAFCQFVRRFASLVGNLDPLVSILSSQPSFFDIAEDKNKVLSEIDQKLSTMEIRLKTMRPDLSSSGHIPNSSPAKEMTIGRRMKNFVETLRRFADAYAWSYSGLIWPGEGKLPEHSPRNRTVLFADLGGSTPRSLILKHQRYTQWDNRGLNLIAQWGHAFGGRETTDIYPRRGDSVCIEFTHPDSAILCSAIIQEHIKALRSTGVEDLNYYFRIAIDSGWLSDADGANVIGLAINRAAKLLHKLEERHGKGEALDKVFVTPETVRDCSNEVRGCLSEHPSGIIDLGVNTARGRFTPFSLDCALLFEKYIELLQT